MTCNTILVLSHAGYDVTLAALGIVIWFNLPKNPGAGLVLMRCALAVVVVSRLSFAFYDLTAWILCL